MQKALLLFSIPSCPTHCFTFACCPTRKQEPNYGALGQSWFCHHRHLWRWSSNVTKPLALPLILRDRAGDRALLAGHLQGHVVRHSLGLSEVLGLVLRDDVPRDAVVDAVLQQHRLVHGVGAAHVAVAAVCLRWAPDLQDKHDFAEKHEGEIVFTQGSGCIKEFYCLITKKRKTFLVSKAHDS